MTDDVRNTPPARSCMSCRFAEWARTAAGRLHPSGDGRCTWPMPEIKIPASRYYIGRDNKAVPRPLGGAIERKRPHIECPTWEGDWP